MVRAVRRLPIAVAAVLIATVLGIGYVRLSRSTPREAGDSREGSAPLGSSSSVASASPAFSAALVAPAQPAFAPDVWSFGSTGRALGRGTTADGHPIAPASFLVDGDGLIVLDQENRRIVRSDGTSIPLPGARADDVALADDGSLAVLDRLDGKDVTIVDAQGHVRGRFPIEGSGVEQARDITRVVVSGSDVLVERNGGGPLLRIGTTDGKPSSERVEIAGLPTGDGSALVSAGITSEQEGRAWVTVSNREGVHRWTRELTFPGELSAVGFVDSRGGAVWVVLLAGASPAEYTNWAVCLDAGSGGVRGSATLAVENPPWQSFRDFAVRDDGSLVAAMRSDRGVAYTTYPCGGVQ